MAMGQMVFHVMTMACAVVSPILLVTNVIDVLIYRMVFLIAKVKELKI